MNSYPANDLRLERTLGLSSASLLSADLDAATMQDVYFDISASSRGIMTDSQFGGLRTDLTTLLSRPLGPDYTGKTIIPDLTPTGASASIAPTEGGTWDQLKAFYELSATVGDGSTPVEVRPSTATEMDISPVIISNRLMLGLRLEPERDQ